MAVYVDDMNLQADVPDGIKFVRGRWSHLFADTEDELRAFAAKIGLKQDWIQHPGQPHARFDVTGRMRQRAIAAGATPITWRHAGEFFAERTGASPDHHPQGSSADPAGHVGKPETPSGQPQRGGTTAGRALRQAAHFYLGHGLLPVPAWATRADGSCRCPRGAACPRPGKHPRSVHAGPGERGYSWKPLACHTPVEVEQRFADGGRYAEANLMLAIPPGMLVVDQDDDDGGPQAIATLAAQLGDLPPTLAHKTPHGVHRIYRTPPGWTGRAWVGKDARNPLPAGIDLRVPGQILMAPPSQVPAPGGLAAYGPATGADVAELPAAYLAAWTPPQPLTSRPRRPVPVPPGRADTVARYVHNKITGILADLENERTARNTALYIAALKIGSTLGAARTTPGAEHAAADWTGQAAEDALIDAAETNGYLAKDGAAQARSAIRSGLRNGLRNPRPLPDFTAQPTTPPPAHSTGRRELGGQARPHRHAQAAPPARSQDASPRATAAQPEDTQPVLSITRGDTRFAMRDQAAGEHVTLSRAEANQVAPAATTSPGSGQTGRTRSAGQAHAAPVRPRQDAGTGPGRAVRPAPQALSHEAPDVGSVSAVLRAAGFVASSEALQAVHAAEGYQVQAAPEGHILIRHVAIGEPVNGVGPAARTQQMLAGYAHALQAAGFHVTSPARDSLIAQPEAARHATPGRERAGQAAGRQAPARSGPVAHDAYRTPHPVVAGTARPRRPARERAHEPGTDPQAGRTPAEPQPLSPDHPSALPSAGGGRQQQARPSGETTGRGTTAGWTITPGHVRARDEALPQGTGDSHRQHPATGTDRPAGTAFGSRDPGHAYRLLTGAPTPGPARHQRQEEHEKQTGEHAAPGMPRPLPQGTEKAPCPQCGTPHIRPTGETYPCLSCETQARLKAAGFTAGSPEIKRIAEWNHTVFRDTIRDPEMPQPPPNTGTQAGQKADPQATAGPEPALDRVKDLDREREASG